MKFAANMTWLFTELPVLDRPAAAAEAGFVGTEILFPYDTDPIALRDALQAAGQPLALMNMPKGETFGVGAIPGATEQFRRELELALGYARTVGSETLHVLSGLTNAPEARATMVSNLKYAAAEAPDLHLSIEPLTKSVADGYFLDDYYLAADIVAEVDAPNLAAQFDSFHAEMIHGDALSVWKDVGERCRHVQISEAPERGAPGPKTMALLQLFADEGHDGWIAGEYAPGGPTQDTLGWLAEATTIQRSKSN